MRLRHALLLAGVSMAAALSAGLVVAQTMTMPQDAPPPGAPPPTAPTPITPPPSALPPQETAPPAAPAPNANTAGASSAPSANDGAAGSKDDSNPDQAEAKPDAPAVDPAKRQVYSAAVIEALDKITAETMRFEVTTDRPVRWKGLVFTLKTCETSAPDEPVKDSMAFLQVRSEPHAQSEEASREVFRGWMFASSPALNPLQHPVYDAWLIACRA